MIWVEPCQQIVTHILCYGLVQPISKMHEKQKKHSKQITATQIHYIIPQNNTHTHMLSRNVVEESSCRWLAGGWDLAVFVWGGHMFKLCVNSSGLSLRIDCDSSCMKLLIILFIKILEEFGLRFDLCPPKNCSEKQIVTLLTGAEGGLGWLSLRFWNKHTGAH